MLRKTRWLPSVLLVLTIGWIRPGTAAADVVVLYNGSPATIDFTIEGQDTPRRRYRLEAADVVPVPVVGDVRIAFPSGDETRRYRLVPNSVQYFVAGKGQVELRTVELPAPGDEDRPAETTAGPPLKPVYTIPVMLLADDDERAVRRLWERRLRERLAEASRIFEAHCRVRFETVAVGTWVSEDDVNDFSSSLREFERKVTPLPARLAVGFTSQYEKPPKRIRLGGIRGPLRPHILIREWSLHLSEPERLEVLVHELGHYLGAVHSPDPNSAMRQILGDGRAKARSFRIGLDPLNTLVTYRLGEEFRSGRFQGFHRLRPDVKTQLRGVYRVLAEALPDDDSTKLYTALLETPATFRPVPLEHAEPLVAGTRSVVRAITEAAQENRSAASPLSGDRLSELCIRRAAAAAAELPEDVAAKAFLLGTAVAMDDSHTLRNSPFIGDLCRRADSPQQADVRRAALRRATMRGRRDLLKHFVVSAGLAALVGPDGARTIGIVKELHDARTGSGFSFVDLAADLAGIEFAGRVSDRPVSLARLATAFRVEDCLPEGTDLEEGLSWEQFLGDYGSAQDDRFYRQLVEIRRRIKAIDGRE